MKCWLLWIWNMSPGSRESKDAVADNAEVYVDGTRALDASASLRVAHHCNTAWLL